MLLGIIYYFIVNWNHVKAVDDIDEIYLILSYLFISQSITTHDRFAVSSLIEYVGILTESGRQNVLSVWVLWKAKMAFS